MDVYKHLFRNRFVHRFLNGQIRRKYWIDILQGFVLGRNIVLHYDIVSSIQETTATKGAQSKDGQMRWFLRPIFSHN